MILKRFKKYLLCILIISVISGLVSLLTLNFFQGIINSVVPTDMALYVRLAIMWVYFLVISAIFFYNMAYSDKESSTYNLKEFAISTVISVIVSELVLLLPALLMMLSVKSISGIYMYICGYNFTFLGLTGNSVISSFIVAFINIVLYILVYKYTGKAYKKETVL